MILPSLSRRQFIVLALQLMAASQLPACRAPVPVIGRNPVKNPLVVEDHSQVLALWAEKGIKDAVLINIDTHDDIRWIPEEKMDRLRQLYQQRDWPRFKEADSLSDNGLYHIGNWIYAGGHLGMFREVYWVIPVPMLSQQDPELHLRQFLKRNRFNDLEIEKFSLRDRQFRGSFHGIPLTICDIESLPDIGTPLLLSVDTDFFPPYSSAQEKSYLPALHAVFQALYRKKYQIQDAVVCYSVNGNYLPPYLRWVGDAVGAILRKPGLIDEPPAELLVLLQQIDNDYRGTDAGQMLRLIENYQSRYPTAALQLYKAYAHLLQEDPDNAYEAAMQACRRDPRYCTGLADLGTYYYGKGRYALAEKFFRAGFVANPDMGNGLFHYGHCLRQTGRVKEAIACYEKDEAIFGTFPTRFLIAELFLLLRDRQSAVAALEKAVDNLSGDRYATISNRETAGAIYTALEFCNREGLRDLSRALRSTPAVMEMFTSYPRASSR